MLLRSTPAAVARAAIVIFANLSLLPAAQAEGQPDTTFGTQGFVRYEHSLVIEEPNIERGLHLSMRSDGNLAVLMQHRIQDSSPENAPLIASFDPSGNLLQRQLFATMFFSPPDPPLAAATIDAGGRALVVGDLSGTDMAVTAAVPIFPTTGYSAALQTSIPVNSGALEYHRAVVGLPGGDFIVCGMRSYPLQAAQTLMPMCRRLSPSGTMVSGFGNNVAIGAGVHSFFLNEVEIPGLQRGSILSTQLDSSGRILLGGSIRLGSIPQDLAFSARLLPNGVFDTSYCADAICADAAISAPGWRADAITDTDDITRSVLIERPGDGSIAQIIDARISSTLHLGAALLLYGADGALSYSSSLLLGEWTRIGFQPGVQSDNKLVIPLTYRPGAGTQLGAILRLPADPAADGLFDPDFGFAPAGVTALPGVSIIRPNLPGGTPAASVECNAVLVQPQSITCAGLLRVGDAPLNLDMLLARVTTDAIDVVFRGGFE